MNRTRQVQVIARHRRYWGDIGCHAAGVSRSLEMPQFQSTEPMPGLEPELPPRSVCSTQSSIVAWPRAKSIDWD